MPLSFSGHHRDMYHHKSLKTQILISKNSSALQQEKNKNLPNNSFTDISATGGSYNLHLPQIVDVQFIDVDNPSKQRNQQDAPLSNSPLITDVIRSEAVEQNSNAKTFIDQGGEGERGRGANWI